MKKPPKFELQDIVIATYLSTKIEGYVAFRYSSPGKEQYEYIIRPTNGPLTVPIPEKNIKKKD